MEASAGTSLLDQLSSGYRIDRKLGVVFDRIPSSSDDLTLIRGIGTREAVLLNRLGIYQHAQVGLWDRSELVAVADELGMPASHLIHEGWIDQARQLCSQRQLPVTAETLAPEVLPASFVRTTFVLVCAMLIGCFCVYWISRQQTPSYRGVLSAEITSLRVPANARLLKSYCEPGDEVFTGQPLVTFEKTEHLALIEQQRNEVRALNEELKKAEAQASLDLQWRIREIESEISEMQTRASLVGEIEQDQQTLMKSVSLSRATSESNIVTTEGQTAKTNPRTTAGDGIGKPPNGMIFFAAAGGTTAFVKTDDVPKPRQVQIPLIAPARPKEILPAPTRVAFLAEPASSPFLKLEAQTIQKRLDRLESLRKDLPEQVRRAAGVETIRSQLSQASRRLKMMEELDREVKVVCPAYGRVGQIRYKSGDSMVAGEVLLKVLHTDRRYINVHVPTSQIAEIQPGRNVELTFPDGQQYTGKIANLPMLAEADPSGRTTASVRITHTGKLWADMPIGSEVAVRLK